MFSRISNLIVAKRIQKLLKQNRIEVRQFQPGYLDLKSPLWQTDHAKWGRLVKELHQDKRITAVTYNQVEGTMLILFDESLMDDLTELERLLKQVENIS